MSEPLIRFESRSAPQILIGDCLDKLKGLATNSVDCCVTSPPYFNLRDYQTGTWDGGDLACEHLIRQKLSTAASTLGGSKKTSFHSQEGFRTTCPQCGATRIDQQIGMEETPEAYVSKLVTVFQEVHRVLKDSGTLWLNLGDSYANDDKWGGFSGGKHAAALHGATGIGRGHRHTGLKPKDLIGIPWACAFALRTAGWYLRSDIIWNKNNAFPESVKDRCTKSHEYVFMFSKSKIYYFDADAIAEPTVANASTRNRRTVWSINTKPFHKSHFAVMPIELAALCILAGTSEHGCCATCGAPWGRAEPIGWQPSCACAEAAPVPCTVLDPFGGAGTTGLVAQRLGRRSILIELNPAYAEIARHRIEQD